MQQKTISKEILLSGIGLHQGKLVRMRLLPAPENQGIVFRRIDLPGRPGILASYKNIVSSHRGMVMASGEATVATTEHLMAAFWSAGIDNVTVEIDGSEVPAMDGSALPLTVSINQAGTTNLGATKSPLIAKKAFTIKENQSEISVSPYRGLRITFMVDYPGVGAQSFVFDEKTEFESEIAPARTFGYLQEVEALKAKGLALGAGMENALVLDREKGYVNVPRFPDEPVRHKILDLLGDLYLTGKNVHAEIKATRSSHQLNLVLANKLMESASAE